MIKLNLMTQLTKDNWEAEFDRRFTRTYEPLPGIQGRELTNIVVTSTKLSDTTIIGGDNEAVRQMKDFISELLDSLIREREPKPKPEPEQNRTFFWAN